MTHRAIVLAAGRGTRLVNGGGIPKPLKRIATVPLLVRILRTLQAEGIREVVVVTGYLGDQIREALLGEPSLALKLVFVDNDEYEKSNGVSLLAAKEYVVQGCLLTMADHLYSPEIVRRLQTIDLPRRSCVLAVDHDIPRCFDIDDATKVLHQRGKITRIDKQLGDYNALDTGVFRIGPSLIDELQRVYDERGDCTLSDGIQALSAKGLMIACDIGDARWIDVDTPEAAQRAEAMLHVFGDGLGDEPAGGGQPDPESIELFAPTWVRAATPYNEGHFEIAENRDVLRMMSNENPFRPSARVLEAVMEAALNSNLYPSRAAELREKLASREGLSEENVLLGAGSAELIDLAIRTFVGPGEEVLINVPTFSLYEARTRMVGGIPVMVPMGEDRQFDVPGLIAAITERTKLVFLCTPNNPTGNCLQESQLRRILRLGLPTVVDEAYFELSDDEASYRYLMAEFPNMLILRTFSKAFGLAGMRVGYALGHPALIKLLARVKIPWNISCVAIAACCAALDDIEEQSRRFADLRYGRRQLESELANIAGIKVIPSQGNFVLVDAAGTGLSADEIVKRMLQEGVFIRSLSSHRAGRSLVRITVGDRAQNRLCIDAMRRVARAPASAVVVQ